MESCFQVFNDESFQYFFTNQSNKLSPVEINNSFEPMKNATIKKSANSIGTDYKFKRDIVWFNAIGFAVLHLLALYGCYLCFTHTKFYTVIWMLFLIFVAGEGVTIGAHRLWSHRSFKATPMTRAILLVLQTIAGQNCLWVWVRDHRQHHLYSDTDADPHNARRGFFFSHIGWLMSRKHPLVIEKGKSINMDDIEEDKLIMFQKKHYKILYAIFALAIPILTPVYFWKEDLIISFLTSYLARYIIQLNGTWSVNSVAHLYGTRPYDKNTMGVESTFVSFISSGEGWHNYHHVFPWDYKAAEFGTKLQVTTHIINGLKALGLVYDLKEAAPNMIKERSKRTGDDSSKYKNIKAI